MNQRIVGVILSYVNIAALIVVGLFYTPLMLRLLGQAEYGLYSLIGAFVGYLSILDMGLGNTIVRYISINRITGSKQREAELNTLFLLIYSGLGCLVVCVGTSIYFHLGDIFGQSLSEAELVKAHTMTALLVFNIAASFPLGIFSAVMTVYERFVFLRITNILRVLLNPIVVLPLLYAGYGSVMMVIVSTVLNLSCLLANMWYSFRYLHIRFRIGQYQRTLLWEMAVYSFFIFLNVIMDKIYYSTGQFILGIVSGTRAVAVYAVAIQIIMMYMQFSGAISGVMFPKIARMVAGHATNSDLTNVMIRIGRLQYIVIVYLMVMFFFIGDDFLYLWAGEEYINGYPIVMLLMAVIWVPLIQNTGIAILQAQNRNQYRMTVYILCAACSALISIPLAKVYDGVGCAAATAISVVISTGIAMNWYYQNKIHLDMKKFWKNIMGMTKGTALFVFVVLMIMQLGVFAINWTDFIVQGILYTIIYLGITYLISLNMDEKRFLKGILRLR